MQATSGVTTISTGGGEDTVNIQSIGAATTVNGGDDDDTVNVGSSAPDANGVLTGINALLSVNGDGGANTLNVDATGDTGPNDGTLASASLTGLGMTSGITYAALAELNISLGEFGNTFAIESTSDGTAVILNSGGGVDIIAVGAINGPTTLNAGDGSDIINVTPSADGPVGSLNGSPSNSSINGLLTVVGGEDADDLDQLNFNFMFPSIEPATSRAPN